MNRRTFLAIVAVGGMTGAWCLPASAAQRFEIREPGRHAYVVEASPSVAAAATPGPSSAGPAWLRARREGSTQITELGSRVVLEVEDARELSRLLATSPLRLARVVRPNLVVLEGGDATTALHEASRLAAEPGVRFSHPVRRRPLQLHGRYAPQPDDPLFPDQWHLEHRDPVTAAPLGDDFNIRSAWSLSRGEGVVVAVADDGVDLDHPDLITRGVGQLHRNFLTGASNGNHPGLLLEHGTAVAGLVAAEGNNRVGLSGVAPAVRLASWVIFGSGSSYASEEQTAAMFESQLDRVAVQNHSWGNGFSEQLPLGALEDAALGKAVTEGRGGLGVVLVRAAGNENEVLNDVNDDGYANDPRQIAVGAVRASGRATSYTTPGAPVLVAAFSGDTMVSLPEGGYADYPTLVTTDRVGALGYNDQLENGDYASGETGFSGTSGSTPQIAGLAALMIEVNPRLTWRDIRHALVLAARHLDLADPEVRTNGAGLRVSHRVGFGVPDAGLAVRLARAWPPRPAPVEVTVTNIEALDLPDDGLRVLVSGPRVPATLVSIPAYPSDAPHPDEPTAALELTDVGLALAAITNDLRGRAALIQRGQNNFSQKLGFAAAAGAGFAVVRNNMGGTERLYMGGAETQFIPIPAVFIDQNSGQALSEYLRQNSGVAVQLSLQKAVARLTVTNTLQVDHVRLRARFAHARRADVRLTLVSPTGTRSVLHHHNSDSNSPLGEWDFHSVRHFLESSAGEWTVEASDERPGVTGRLLGVELTISGSPIEDTDRDGLDDDWERLWFAGLAARPADDPDRDGWTNSQEARLGWNPTETTETFQLDLSRWDERLARLSWPASDSFRYEVTAGPELDQPFTVLTNLPGRFPETELILPQDSATNRFFRVRAVER
ncbi:MAG: S8 family serine peptidase [Limisphaerales bacterium]